MAVKVTLDRTAAVLASIRTLARNQVLVGIPATTTDRQPDPEEPQQPLNNAEIGYLMENGSPEANIPARPWLQPGVNDAQPAITTRYESGAKAVLDGKVANLDTVHEQVGIIAQNAVRRKIATGPFTPLAESTLKSRARRGRKGAAAELASRAAGNEAGTDLAKPLNDTGQLRNAATYVVRPKG